LSLIADEYLELFLLVLQLSFVKILEFFFVLGMSDFHFLHLLSVFILLLGFRQLKLFVLPS